MGLIRAGIGALDGALADTWRDYFYCDSLDTNTLVVKGQKRTSSQGRSSNVRGEDNIISNGSIIAVNEGQYMIIVEQGAVIEACGEPGEFVFDSSTEPSLLFGEGSSLKDRILASFQQVGRRFTFGGDTAKDQRVYFFNSKEILGNKYGTAAPVPFRVVDNNIGLDVDIAVRCNGEYSYRIVDPLMFYKNVCGNVEEPYTRDRIDSQLKSELLTALQPAFARISALGVRYSAVPAHTEELAKALNDELSETWGQLRGVEVASFGVNAINASPEDEAMIKDLQKAAVMRDPTMAAANLAASQADAMRMAASNSAGAAM
ncbi:MAG: SPFH domain-containing protein, partial [Coriobacteriales bacterium]|nr:SPFH domain-containing protein [Coriobacteriales bacterium]